MFRRIRHCAVSAARPRRTRQLGACTDDEHVYYCARPTVATSELIDGRWRASASTRSWQGIPACIFAIIWNGLLLLFAGLMISHGAWIALPILSLHFAAGVFVAWIAADARRPDGSTSRSSIGESPSRNVWGRSDWRRSCDRLDIRSVEQAPYYRGGRGFGKAIVLNRIAPIRFGTFLSDERRNFLHAVLATELLPPGKQPPAPRQPPADPVMMAHPLPSKSPARFE